MPISMCWSRSLPEPSARSRHPAHPRAECCSAMTMPFPLPATQRVTNGMWQPRPSRASIGFSCGGRGARSRPTRSRLRSQFAAAPTANRRSVARFAWAPTTSSCRSTCPRVVAWSRCSMHRSPRTWRPSRASARRFWPSNWPPSPTQPCRSRCRKAAAVRRGQGPPELGCPSSATGPSATSRLSPRFPRARTWLPAPSCRLTAGTSGSQPRRYSLAWGR